MEKQLLLGFQKSEITEHYVYKSLAKFAKGKNRDVLLKIARDELAHYNVWKKYTNQDVQPDKKKVLIYSFMARVLGLSFTAKLMERNETRAEEAYRHLVERFKEAEDVLRDELAHENLLLGMIEEKKVEYIGSMVLGLNDALVELSGTLAGLTFALQNSKLIGLAGTITGIAAAMSMSAAEYLSKKSEADESQNPLLAAFFTGVAYIITVILLVSPYLILHSYVSALLWSMCNGVIAVGVFSLFVSVVKDRPFRSIAIEMLGINMSVILISFLVGLLVRNLIGVEV